MRGTAAVFLASLVILAWGARTPGIATAYVDPVAQILAQDEAVYGSSSLAMARHGGWLTPRFLGRYALYKPPLLYWLSAMCAKIAGPNALALRIPSILAGAGTVVLVFALVRATMPMAAALAGALLLLSSHLFFVLSRTALTDALLIFEITLAMYTLARDPRLDTPASRWIFGAATGAAIMTKALAGLLPIVILVLTGVSILRFSQVCAIAAGIALPWHAWQLYEHPRWFWAEYFLGEHLIWGFNAPQQTTQESPIPYYAKRIVLIDPILLAAATIAIFKTRPRLAMVWIGVILLSVVAWQYRNISYLAPMYPAMAIAAAIAIPKRHARAALVLTTAFFVAKILLPHQPFGIPFAPESVNRSQSALDEYAARHRENELIIVEPDDQFYSADLDLPRVRYVWLDSSTNRIKLPLDFEYLGITVSASDFTRLDQLRPVFAERLHEWNFDSTEPIATVILARTQQEIEELIASHPQADFYLPQPSGNHAFRLSSQMIQRP